MTLRQADLNSLLIEGCYEAAMWVVPMVSSKSNAILAAIQRLIPRRSAMTLSARAACLVLPALLLLSGSQAARANQCFVSGPHYQLESDSVEWRMKIRSGENCVRGVRFSYVYNATVSVVSPPRFGQVTIVGVLGFSYTAKTDFQGEDSFIVGVSGSKKKVSGVSTIRVVVSVVGAPEASLPLEAVYKTPLTDWSPNRRCCGFAPRHSLAPKIGGLFCAAAYPRA